MAREFWQPTLYRTCASAALILATACSTFEGLELAAAQAEPDGGSNAHCQLARVPPPPISSIAISEDFELTLAVRRIDFGNYDDEDGPRKYLRIGYDLDGLCTGQGDGPSCVEPPLSSRVESTDGPGGRDNMVGARFYAMKQDPRSPDWPARIANQVETGKFSTLISVRGYNGGIDEEVEVALYAGTWKDSTTENTQDGSTSKVPEWKGEDDWLIFDEWLLPPDGGEAHEGVYRAKYRAARAYVTNDNILVAHFPETLTGSGPFLHVILSGQLVQTTNGAWTLRDATIAGRQRLDDTLAFLERVDFEGTQICKDSPFYLGLRQITCSTADIRSTPSEDRSLPCDAVSIGWMFDADPVKVAGKASWEAFSRSLFPPCKPGMSPGQDDSCADP